MRLILYSWNANNEQILADNFIKAGHEVVWFRKECKHYTRDMELAMEMIPFLHQQNAQAVVSFNYFPIVSMICNTSGIPYYAWVYDCPHFTLYAKQITMPCNHIGIFDKDMVRQLEAYGVGAAYHVPLAADTAYFARTIERADRKEREKYRCDVSFVGSLYADEHNYYDAVCGRAEENGREADKEQEEDYSGGGQETTGRKRQLDRVVERQMFCYDRDFLLEAVSGGTVDMRYIQSRMEAQGLMLGEDYYAEPSDILLAAVLEKKVTVEERRRLLCAVAEMATFTFHLYTGSDLAAIPQLKLCHKGTVDYHKQMPLVFHESRINLNISLRSIHTGIPLRVLDIMACGGFVLTNWQQEIAENFIDGKEVVMFRSLEECMEKIVYYLAHEEERKTIAEAGKKKVETCFSYETGLGRLLDGAGQ